MSTQKLLAQWHGPITVVQRKGRVNYKVDMHDKKRRYRTLHINMLRKWHAPSTVCFASEDREVDMEDDIPVWKEESSSTYALGQDLEDSQWVSCSKCWRTTQMS